MFNKLKRRIRFILLKERLSQYYRVWNNPVNPLVPMNPVSDQEMAASETSSDVGQYGKFERGRYRESYLL
jgi:hypothetical protein